MCVTCCTTRLLVVCLSLSRHGAQSGTLDRRAYKGKVPLRKSAPGGSCDAGSDVCMCIASCSYTKAAGEAVRRLSEERSSQEIKP